MIKELITVGQLVRFRWKYRKEISARHRSGFKSIECMSCGCMYHNYDPATLTECSWCHASADCLKVLK